MASPRAVGTVRVVLLMQVALLVAATVWALVLPSLQLFRILVRDPGGFLRGVAAIWLLLNGGIFIALLLMRVAGRYRWIRYLAFGVIPAMVMTFDQHLALPGQQQFNLPILLAEFVYWTAWAALMYRIAGRFFPMACAVPSPQE